MFQIVKHSRIYFVYAGFDRFDNTASANDCIDGRNIDPCIFQFGKNKVFPVCKLGSNVRITTDLFG